MGVTSDILIETPKNRKHITGDPIKGLVKFDLDKDTVYKKISLSLVEKGYCKWYENAHSYRAHHGKEASQRRKVGKRFVFEGHETKVVKKIQLLNKTTNENITLSAGSHEQAFEIIIPENIPPSMKTDIGEIKYYLVLKFKKPRIINLYKKFKTNITIYPSVDASVTDKPLSFAVDKSLTKFFSSYKHEISLKAELDQGYLNPSSERQISFVAANNSNVTFSVKTELINKTKYVDDILLKKYTYGDLKTVRQVIYSCRATPSVSDNCVLRMTIPVAPELCTVRHSKIIMREYKIKVTLELPVPHINSSVEIPVFVGERFNEGSDVAALESSTPMEEQPSYWENMFEDNDNK